MRHRVWNSPLAVAFLIEIVSVTSETSARICILAVVANQYDAIKRTQEALKVVLPSI